MLAYSWYILKVITCSGVLFGYYWLFLRNKLFHQYNRFYILSALTASLLLPLLKIDFWQHSQQGQVIKALQVVSAGDEYMNNVVITANNNWSIQQLYPLIYWLVSIIFFMVLLQTLLAIRSLLKKYPVQQIDDISFVNTDDKSTPFSFLKYIFWNANIDMATTTGKQIFKHEVVHIQERHTYDKLFINIILVFFWCNPFFWLYRRELNMIHEFIADKKAVENSDTAAFAAMILQATYPQHRFPIANNFFYSPIKRRIAMLTKKNNPRLSYIARVMVLPLAVIIFAAFSFKVKNEANQAKGLGASSLHDTAPSNTKLPTIAQWVTAGKDMVEEIDPEKALLVVNGKIIGKGKAKAAGFSNQLYAASVTVKWLQKKEAMAKYGDAGADGACEVTYTDGAIITTQWMDENKMSVFYIGLENEMTVTAQNVRPEDLVVNVSEGKVIGSNGKYMVRVTRPGEVIITLSKRDGTKIPGSFSVTAKMLPNTTDGNLKKFLTRTVIDTVPEDIKQKQLIELKAAENNQKLLLDKMKVEQASKELLLKSTNEEIKKLMLDNKLKNQDLQNEKQLLLKQKAQLNKGQKELLLKNKNAELKKLALDQKLNNQELVNEKIKLLTEAQLNKTIDQELELKTKQDLLEKVTLQQKELLQQQQDNKVFSKVEVESSFPGGVEAWRKFLAANMKSFVLVDNGAKAGKYIVIVKFIVKTDGSLSDISCEKDPGFGACAEALNVMKKSPNWIPATQNGHTVSAWRKQPITFVIEEQ